MTTVGGERVIKETRKKKDFRCLATVAAQCGKDGNRRLRPSREHWIIGYHGYLALPLIFASSAGRVNAIRHERSKKRTKKRQTNGKQPCGSKLRPQTAPRNVSARQR